VKETLEEHYDAMWNESYPLFKRNEYRLDTQINSVNDSRRGITLIAKFSPMLSKDIDRCISTLKAISPEQYYYDSSTLHITVLPIISCEKNFLLSQININEYLRVITNALKGINPFTIKLKGITASPSCILLQGFPLGTGLLTIRDKLRSSFHKSGLLNTMDSRYKLKTAHSTLCRFQKYPSKPDDFLSRLFTLKCTDFKPLHVKELHLVYNDWYHKADTTIVLSKISL